MTTTETPLYDAVKTEQGYDPEVLVTGTHEDFMRAHGQTDWVWETCGRIYSPDFVPPAPAKRTRKAPARPRAPRKR